MPSNLLEIGTFLDSPDWTPGEKSVIKWQFGLHSDFNKALWEAIKRADEANLRRIAYGFPFEVLAFVQWVDGDLGPRLRAAGLEI